MKIVNFILCVLVVFGCSQNKQVAKSTNETIHRYSIVYEGNKIIRYEKVVSGNEESAQFIKNEAEIISVSKQVQSPKVLLPKSKVALLPKLATKGEPSKKRTDYAPAAGETEYTVTEHPTKKNSSGHEGTTGFFLVLGSFLMMPLVYIVINAAGGGLVFGGLLSLIAIVALIFGMIYSFKGIKRRNTQTDYILGWLGLGIPGSIIIFLMLAAIIGSILSI